LLIDNFKESATFSTNIVQYLAKQSNMKICQRSAKPTGEDHYNYLWVLLRIMYNIKLPLLNINNPSTCPLLFSKMYTTKRRLACPANILGFSSQSEKRRQKVIETVLPSVPGLQ
jgi:hypothetical protein